MKKRTHTKYAPLTSAQVQAYRELRHSQEIAWETRNTSRAHELGYMLADLRHENVAYKFID